MNTVEAKIREVIVNVMKRDIDSTSFAGNDLTAELGMTSIDALEILIWIEEEFKIVFSDEDLSSDLVASIPNLAAYVSARMAGKINS